MSEEKIIEFFKSPENLSVLKNSKDGNENVAFLSKNGIPISMEKGPEIIIKLVYLILVSED